MSNAMKICVGNARAVRCPGLLLNLVSELFSTLQHSRFTTFSRLRVVAQKRTTAITKDKIFETADQLAAAGQNPTLAAVRRRGARQAATAPFREPVPPAITDRLADLGADVWAIALKLTGGRLKADREAAHCLLAAISASYSCVAMDMTAMF